MQPNKSVEERLEQFWYLVNEWKNAPTPEDLATSVRNLELFITSHTNTVLQGVVERVGKLKQKELEYTKKPSTNTAIRRMMVRRQSRKNTLDEVSSLLNDQIISNEK